MQQIEDRGYAKAYEADSRTVYCIGASFSSKTGTIEDWSIGLTQMDTDSYRSIGT